MREKVVVPSHERLVYLATCLIGHPVEVQVIDGSVFSGIFHATNADGDFGIILKMARLMKTGSSRGQMDILDSVNKPPSKTLIIPARELVQVMAKNLALAGALLFFIGMKNSLPRRTLKKKTVGKAKTG